MTLLFRPQGAFGWFSYTTSWDTIRVKILYWERNGFCLWLKRLESERFKTSPDAIDEAIVLTVQELNWMLDGFDLWRNRPHQVLTPRFVA